MSKKQTIEQLNKEIDRLIIKCKFDKRYYYLMKLHKIISEKSRKSTCY